jgi:hypothetical protein
MTKRITYDVSPRGSEWTVTKRGASRPTAVCDRKDDAIARAREVAKGFAGVAGRRPQGRRHHPDRVDLRHRSVPASRLSGFGQGLSPIPMHPAAR